MPRYVCIRSILWEFDTPLLRHNLVHNYQGTFLLRFLNPNLVLCTDTSRLQLSTYFGCCGIYLSLQPLLNLYNITKNTDQRISLTQSKKNMGGGGGGGGPKGWSQFFRKIHPFWRAEASLSEKFKMGPSQSSHCTT